MSNISEDAIAAQLLTVRALLAVHRALGGQRLDLIEDDLAKLTAEQHARARIDFNRTSPAPVGERPAPSEEAGRATTDPWLTDREFQERNTLYVLPNGDTIFRLESPLLEKGGFGAYVYVLQPKIRRPGGRIVHLVPDEGES